MADDPLAPQHSSTAVYWRRERRSMGHGFPQESADRARAPAAVSSRARERDFGITVLLRAYFSNGKYTQPVTLRCETITQSPRTARAGSTDPRGAWARTGSVGPGPRRMLARSACTVYVGWGGTWSTSAAGGRLSVPSPAFTARSCAFMAKKMAAP